MESGVRAEDAAAILDTIRRTALRRDGPAADKLWRKPQRGSKMQDMESKNVDESEANENVVNRLIACINDRRVELMDELFHDDAVMHWPQSGELVRGAENRRGIYNAFPQLPTITLRRLVSGGDLVVAEASLDYGGPKYETVFIFEFRDGKIARETAYWSEAFEAPAWRAQWVEKA